MMQIYHTLQEIECFDRDIQELRDKLNHGVQAWEDGTDECAMAECDPSDHFVIGEELEELHKHRAVLVTELKELVREFE